MQPMRLPWQRAGTLSCALALMWLASGGCRHVAVSGGDADALYPLEPGMTWTFRLEDSEGPVMDIITRVDRVEGDLVHLTSGMSTYSYQLRDDGVYRPSMDSYLIKEPLSAGMTWEGVHGFTVTVTAVDQEITVPAGTFRGCVSIDESIPSGEGPRQVHTFCPGVGPVRVEQFLDGSFFARGELIGFGPVDEVP